MKIVCDACQAKYSIADEKIQGKAFKIRCKKCNHIIVVRTTGEVATVAPSSSPDKQKAVAAAAAPAAAEQGVWHVVVDGEQVGPIAEPEVRDKLRLGQLNGDSLVWREGFADWTALSAVPELVALQPKRTSAARAAVHEPLRPSVAGMAVPSTGSPSPDAGDVFAAATVVTQPSSDLFAASAGPQAVPAPVAPAPSSPFLFGGAPASEPAVVIKNPGNGAGGTQLTGQRNENSVLFSLSNLEALAVPSHASPGIRAPSSTSTTEGSGLIDIRSMAAMTLHEGGGDARRSSEALPTFSTPQFSPVAPVLLPISNSGPPKWVYPVMGLLAVGILILGYGIYRVMAAPPPGTPIIIQQAAPPPPPAAAPAPAPAPAAAPATEAAKSATAEETPAPSEERKASDKGKSSSGRSDRSHRGSSRSESRRGSESSAASGSESSSSRGRGRGKDKDIGALVSEFGKKGPAEAAKPAAPQVKLVTLTQSDIVSAMKGVQPRVQACANQFKVPGTAMANISVASGGKVSSAKVTGKFAGTPTGSCVEVAAKAAKFPACQSMNFPWPFTLSPR
jgi:predicted Zn finger-like uncharacterized protein